MKISGRLFFAIYFILIVIVLGVFCLFHSKQSNSIAILDHVNTNKLDVIEELPSPNGNQKLTIYLYGGVFLKSDYSYIGQLTSKGHKKGKFILWLSPDKYNVSWVNNHEILINHKKINVQKEKYDFRY